EHHRAGDRCLGPRGPRGRRGTGGQRSPARRGDGAGRGLPRAARRQGGRPGRGRPGRGDGGAVGHRRPRGPLGQLRRPALLDGHGVARERRADGARAGALHPHRDAAAVLRARVGGARGRAGRRPARGRGPRHGPPPPGVRAPLPAAPALGARGADHGREEPDGRGGVDPAVQRAHVGDRGGAARGARGARRRPLEARVPRPRGAPHDPGGRHGGAAARAAHARLHPQHAPARQGGGRPPAPLPDLAVVAQPRQRGLGRVRPGARPRRQGELRPAAALVRAQGAAARPGPPGRLRPHGRRGRGGRGRGLGRRPRARPRLVQRLLPRPGRHRPALLRRALDRRARAPGQARRRVLRVHGPERPPVRPAQLHLQAPRRPDARARARPRPARRAGPAPRGLRAAHAADAGGDRERVRRDARLPPPARGGRHPGEPPLAAGREHRGIHRHGLPPDRHEPVRGARAHRAPDGGRAQRGPHRRAVGRLAVRAARGRRRGHGQLQAVVELRPALHRDPGVRLRLRLRPAPRALGLRPVPRARGGLRPLLRRAAQRGRLQVARGARADRGARPGRPRVLDLGHRARPGPARRRRGRRGGGPGGEVL
ncbi:MAG: Oligoendopeptidase F, partial [uncultured Solirubrobacteraceae bacterium]